MQAGAILLVDNDPAAQSQVGKALDCAGCDWAAVVDGAAALARLRARQFKGVIVDSGVAGMPLERLISELREVDAGVHVFCTSAQATVEEAVSVMKAGASDYILKPCTPEALAAVVERIRNNGNAPGRKSAREGGHDAPDRQEIVTRDPAFLKTLDMARDVAGSPATVLVYGESGTGKELLARLIHTHSGRRNGPYVAVNCAALPETLAESELFGHEKGAFTGALCRRLGRFELADKGTLVLDEISEMPLVVQSKLLRALQERKVDRVGGTAPVRIDVRLIVLTNRDLAAAVREGVFREDLYYRINVIPLCIPPLRERSGDIPVLARHFLDKYASWTCRPVPKISGQTLHLLTQRYWGGNVRELENTIQRGMLLCRGDTVLPEHLCFQTAPGGGGGPAGFHAGVSMREMEKRLISETLKEVNGNRTHAAKMLGISIRTLRNKLNEYRSQSSEPERDADRAGA